MNTIGALRNAIDLWTRNLWTTDVLTRRRGSRSFGARPIWLVAVTVTLWGCASTENPADQLKNMPVSISPNVQLFGPSIDVPDRKQIFALSGEQRDDFLRYFNNVNNVAIPEHRRIFNYLASRTEDFDYDGDTFTASQALEKENGNCLSLAVLTGALTDLVNVKINYQLVDSIPVFGQTGNVNVRSNHIRSRLSVSDHDQHDTTIMFRSSSVIVDYFQSDGARIASTLSEDEFIANFYRNRAAEALGINDHKSSYWWLNAARKHDPTHPELFNMLALVYRRAGDMQTAEEHFKQGMQLPGERLSLLKNYRDFLTTQQRHAESVVIDEIIQKLNDGSPFDYMDLARSAMTQGNYRDSEYLFIKALRIAPYMYQAHLGLAQSRLFQGKKSSAMIALQEAINYASNEGDKDRFEAKLFALRNLEPRSN